MSERTTTAQVIPPAKPQRSMVIHGLTPRLPERGKLKIGGLSEQERTAASGRGYRPPVKYDHFVITTLERDKTTGNFVRDEAMHERFGPQPTVLPIRLLYDDPILNFPTRYACFMGRTLWCAGDGRSAERLAENKKSRFTVDCTCELADPTIARKSNELRCKMNGALSVMIEGASGLGGVWKFRTTSYNSILELLSTMSYIRTLTGGPLANIPLLLTVRPRTATNPVTGDTVQIFVVGIEFSGDVEQLQDHGHRIALARATNRLVIEHIEEEARRNLALMPPDRVLPGDDEKVVDEFYSEQVGAGDAPPRPRRQDFGPDKQKGEAEAGADAGQATTAASDPPEPARNQQAASSPKDAVGDTGGGDVAPGAEAGGGSVSEAASSTPEAEDGSEKPFSFADQFGEIHEFADLDEALQVLATQVLGVAEMKHLEALGENGQALCEVAEDAQLVGVRDAWKKAKARLTAPPQATTEPTPEPEKKTGPEPEKTVSDNPLHDELCALPDVKSIQARWIKLTTDEKARLPWKTWKEYAAKVTGATP